MKTFYGSAGGVIFLCCCPLRRMPIWTGKRQHDGPASSGRAGRRRGGPSKCSGGGFWLFSDVPKPAVPDDRKPLRLKTAEIVSSRRHPLVEGTAAVRDDQDSPSAFSGRPPAHSGGFEFRTKDRHSGYGRPPTAHDAVLKTAMAVSRRRFQVSETVFAAVSDVKSPQGILAVTAPPSCGLAGPCGALARSHGHSRRHSGPRQSGDDRAHGGSGGRGRSGHDAGDRASVFPESAARRDGLHLAAALP